jgi:hypothetical protein
MFRCGCAVYFHAARKNGKAFKDCGTLVKRSATSLMSERPKLASIECAQCSTLLEVYPQRIPEKPAIEWITQDENLCKSPPVSRCPHARTEIERRFPGFDS